ncbi:hypothetical protein BCR43DRAFT_345407 [Syncephalastrum racemosum]|uniref:Uncharacterized protein n=1 Tax=Syncephalastrum racemosum TaxID=13706 RepID=A0A1X2H5L7_SYNRA|nr:hypothetical protein BCR43DRAFT_345407 [Syncephalastrum racemosum]
MTKSQKDRDEDSKRAERGRREERRAASRIRVFPLFIMIIGSSKIGIYFHKPRIRIRTQDSANRCVPQVENSLRYYPSFGSRPTPLSIHSLSFNHLKKKECSSASLST